MKKPTKNETPELPETIADCHSLLKILIERIADLEKQLSRRNRAAFAKKSAKVDASLLTGAGKAIHEQTTEELDIEKQNLNIVPETKSGGGRSKVSDNVKLRNIEHRLEKHELPCPCCGDVREIIGFEVSHQIDFVQTVFEYIKNIAFKYSCKSCKGQIVTARKPYQPIDKGIAGPGLLAKISTDKFWLHLPLYRQEQVFGAMNIPINRSSMCRWLKEIADLAQPLVQRMTALTLRSRVVQSDATTLPVIKKGLGKTHRGFVWVYRDDKDFPYVTYDYSNTEHSLYPEKILSGYKGVLQTDGTNKYNAIIANGATPAACWAHVNCYFEDAWSHDPIAAEFPMGVIKSLFDIERVAAGLSDAEKKDLRQRLSKPKLALLKEWLEDTKHIVLPKSKLGDAIAYTLKRWPALLVYLEYPFVEISNNASERSIKPLVLSRRNWLFAGSEEGGQTAATIMSLIETCKRLGINPFEYMKDLLTRFPSAKTSEIDNFLPDRWLAAKKLKPQPDP